jgi:hypothetical protein
MLVAPARAFSLGKNIDRLSGRAAIVTGGAKGIWCEQN